jgi:hypothetical protein
MSSSDIRLATMSLICGIVSGLLVCGVAWFYFRRIRMERPAIGVFNRRDVGVLFALLLTVPLVYLNLPRWMTTTLLGITFFTACSFGLRPLLRPAAVWLTVGFLLGLDIWTGNNLLGSVEGWQIYWLENSVIVLIAAVSVSNLYVQGGMQLRHVAWFAAALAVYDVVFTEVWPVTIQLVQGFLGYPLDPSIGMRVGFDNVAVGLGDLLVYSLFTIAALKAYGPAAGRFALALVVLFGSVVPALVPLVLDFVDPRTLDVLVPAQAWFGPAAYLGYRWLRHKHGPERTMGQFWKSSDFLGRRPAPEPVTAPAVAPAPAEVPATP